MENVASTSKQPWVLLVEDEEEVALVLGEGLKEAGFRVVFAYTVSEAVTKLSKQKFDVIITDLLLGKGSGEDVINTVRKPRSLNVATPLLLMSGHLDVELVKRVRGMVGSVLVKPFNLPTLVERIRGLLPEGGRKDGEDGGVVSAMGLGAGIKTWT